MYRIFIVEDDRSIKNGALPAKENFVTLAAGSPMSYSSVMPRSFYSFVLRFSLSSTESSFPS